MHSLYALAIPMSDVRNEKKANILRSHRDKHTITSIQRTIKNINEELFDRFNRYQVLLTFFRNSESVNLV